jgi:hypothetical protein
MKCHLHLLKKYLFHPGKVQTKTGIIVRYLVKAKLYVNNMTTLLKIKQKKKKKKYTQALMCTAINKLIRGKKKFKGFVHSQALSPRPYLKRCIGNNVQVWKLTEVR